MYLNGHVIMKGRKSVVTALCIKFSKGNRSDIVCGVSVAQQGDNAPSSEVTYR